MMSPHLVECDQNHLHIVPYAVAAAEPFLVLFDNEPNHAISYSVLLLMTPYVATWWKMCNLRVVVVQ